MATSSRSLSKVRCGGKEMSDESSVQYLKCMDCGNFYRYGVGLAFCPHEIPSPFTNPPIDNETVNHPPHYTFGKFEVVEVLDDWFRHDPLLWQVGKYLARASHKGNLIEDLNKAKWYLDRKISQTNERK